MQARTPIKRLRVASVIYQFAIKSPLVCKTLLTASLESFDCLSGILQKGPKKYLTVQQCYTKVSCYKTTMHNDMTTFIRYYSCSYFLFQFHPIPRIVLTLNNDCMLCLASNLATVVRKVCWQADKNSTFKIISSNQ